MKIEITVDQEIELTVECLKLLYEDLERYQQDDKDYEKLRKACRRLLKYNMSETEARAYFTKAE